MINYDEDLEELDRIWPLGKQLVVPDGGIVLVAGAYEGRYMDYVLTRFKPEFVIGFEPQRQKADIARARMRQHAKGSYSVFPFGLGVHSCMTALDNVGSDGCCVAGGRIINHNSSKVSEFYGVDDVLAEYGKFDLFICNMEGYEIPLLAYLCVTARLKEIKSLAVQFHKESNVPFLLTKVYGVPVYDDLPTWGYWRVS